MAVLSVSMVSTSFAGVGTPHTVRGNTGRFTAQDMQMVFNQNGSPIQYAALSQREMRQTEGAFWQILAGLLVSGIVNSLIGQAKHYAQTGEFASLKETGVAFGIGVIGGAHGGVVVKTAQLTGMSAIMMRINGGIVSGSLNSLNVEANQNENK